MWNSVYFGRTVEILERTSIVLKKGNFLTIPIWWFLLISFMNQTLKLLKLIKWYKFLYYHNRYGILWYIYKLYDIWWYSNNMLTVIPHYRYLLPDTMGRYTYDTQRVKMNYCFSHSLSSNNYLCRFINQAKAVYISIYQ